MHCHSLDVIPLKYLIGKMKLGFRSGPGVGTRQRGLPGDRPWRDPRALR